MHLYINTLFSIGTWNWQFGSIIICQLFSKPKNCCRSTNSVFVQKTFTLEGKNWRSLISLNIQTSHWVFCPYWYLLHFSDLCGSTCQIYTLWSFCVHWLLSVFRSTIKEKKETFHTVPPITCHNNCSIFYKISLTNRRQSKYCPYQ